MPRIAGYISEATNEEKFGENFINDINARIESMNTSQLLTMYEHLKSTSKSSGYHVWGDANDSVMSKKLS